MGKRTAGGHSSVAFVQRFSTGWSRLLEEVSLFFFKWIFKYLLDASYFYKLVENILAIHFAGHIILFIAFTLFLNMNKVGWCFYLVHRINLNNVQFIWATTL